jgi:hypothetical protein
VNREVTHRSLVRRETLHEGLMTTQLGTRTLLLHTHPDGARLAHGPNIGGISPGLYVELGAGAYTRPLFSST